jgi:hypothetical protein
MSAKYQPPKFKSFGAFLKATPKNLWGSITSTVIGIALVLGAISEPFDPKWIAYPVILLLAAFFFLTWYRVWDIYRDLKDTSSDDVID